MDELTLSLRTAEVLYEVFAEFTQPERGLESFVINLGVVQTQYSQARLQGVAVGDEERVGLLVVLSYAEGLNSSVLAEEFLSAQ